MDAGRDAELVVGRDQAVDHELRARADADVSAHVGGADLTAQPNVAVAAQADAAVGACIRFGPGGRGQVELGRSVRPDGTAGRRANAHTCGVGCAIDRNAARGPELAAHGGAAQHKARARTHVDGGVFAGPAGCLGHAVVSGARIDATQHADGSARQFDAAVIGLAVEHRITAQAQSLGGREGEQGIGGHDHTARTVGGAQVDVAARAQQQVLAGGRGHQAEGGGADVAPGGHAERSSQGEAAAQGHVADGLNDHLVVIGGRGGQAALDDAGNHHIVAAQGHEGAGLQPAAALGHGERAFFAGDVQARQLGVAPADDAVDQHVVQTRQHNAATRVAGDQLAGAQRGQAGFQRVDVGRGAGVHDDVALRFQAAADLQRLLGVDDDVRITAQGHQLALKHGVARRAERHATAERFQTAAGGQQHVLLATGTRQGVEVDAGVSPHIPRQGDRAAGLEGIANEHFGAACAGVHRGQAQGRGAGACGLGIANLGKTQALGAAAVCAGDAELVTTDEL